MSATTADLPGGKTSARSLSLTEVERVEVARKLLTRSEPGEGDCLLWLGGQNTSGYGVMRYGGPQPAGAHRLAYAAWSGDIPAGMTVDHLCFQPLCINPAHLRLLTVSQNCANQRKVTRPTCRQGHAWDEQNTAWQATPNGRSYRRCRACERDRRRSGLST